MRFEYTRRFSREAEKMDGSLWKWAEGYERLRDARGWTLGVLGDDVVQDRGCVEWGSC